MLADQVQHLIAIVAYMAVVIAIGAVFAKRANKDTEAYFLGGRTLGPWVSRMERVSGRAAVSPAGPVCW